MLEEVSLDCFKDTGLNLQADAAQLLKSQDSEAKQHTSVILERTSVEKLAILEWTAFVLQLHRLRNLPKDLFDFGVIWKSVSSG